MSATHAGKEGRDPSPSPGVKPVSSGSSDEIEPWDEPPSKSNTRDELEPPNQQEDMMKNALSFEFLGDGGGGNDERLMDDGDLPTLSLKKESVRGQFVSGERSTRPLSPPSTKGLEVKDNDPPMRRSREQSKKGNRPPTPRTAKQAAAQRQFWSQLNPPSPFETDSSRDQDEHHEPDGEHGPHDEMAARRAARSCELDNLPKQEDETIEGDEDGRGNVNKVNSYEGGGNCIEYTLASIGDICGTNAPPSSVKDEVKRPIRVREVREFKERMADNAEEHTAIEVEYVDPGPRPRRAPAVASRREQKKQVPAKLAHSRPGKELPTTPAADGESVELRESEASAWSSSRKNAVLAAMARKAKEDFQKHEDEVSKQGTSVPTTRRKIESTTERDNTSDIYNSFSPSEKRKFLKLINLGLTPTESTTRVVEERKDKDSIKTPGNASKKRFSFWKKSAKVDVAHSPASPLIEDAPSVSSTAAVGEDADLSVDQNDAESAVAATKTPHGNVGSDPARSKAYSPPVPPAKEESVIPERVTPREEMPDTEQLEEGVGSSSMSSVESVDSEELVQEDNSNVAAAVIASTAAGAVSGVGVVAARQAIPAAPMAVYEDEDDESSEEEEEDSIRGQFPRSGVNYYDGVRRELLEEEDSEEEFGGELHSPSGKTSKGPRLASLAITPRSQGFNSLHESERNISDSEAEVSKSVAKPLSPLARQPKSTSKERSDPLSPGGSASARRRYLGIPILGSKGFTPLEEDEGGGVGRVAEAKVIHQEVLSYHDGQLSKEVQSTVAAAAVAAAVSVRASQAADTTGDRPLRSMDDPFYGLDSEDATEAEKQSVDEVAETPDASFVQPKEQTPEVDTSLDSYLDSATIQAYASQQDQHSVLGGSVVSGRSAYTAGTGTTGMSGHTQSSRKRRPGAAKDRIAKAKQASVTSPSRKGWHESIRAAAATNNRIWDPQKGWIDYKDPGNAVQDISNVDERLHISLDRVSMRSPRAKDNGSQTQQDDVSQSPSVSVPFPPGWEKERNEMISSGRSENSVPQDVHAPSTPPFTPRSGADSEQSLETPVQPSDQEGSPHPRSVVSDDSPKSRGWVESMREASAEVSKDGRHWDPETGWVGLDKSVVESSPLRPRLAPETEQAPEPTDDEDAIVEEDTAVVNMKEAQRSSPNTIFAALTKVPSEGKIQDAHEYAEKQSHSEAPRSKETKIDSFIQKSSRPTAAINHSEHSFEGSDQAVVAGVGEKYVQLGENGLVRSVRRDTRTKKQPSEREEKLPLHPSSLLKGNGAVASKSAKSGSIYDDEKAPLLTGGSTDSTQERGPEVKVVKERVDANDFNLFARDDDASLDTESDSGSPSRRRGTGPVDVDEIDEFDTETESEDGDEDEHPWEPDSYMKGQVSAGMFVKPRSERSAHANSGFAAAISPTKTPPKLKKSRRDTSPIRLGGNGSENVPPREVVSPVAVSPHFNKYPSGASLDREETSRAIEPTVSVGDDSVGSSSVKLLAQKWETRAKQGTQIMQDQSNDSFEYDERQVTALGDFGPSGHEQVDWPGHYEKQIGQPASTGKQEWKSFLGKKVQAETAAAATLEETKRRDRPKPDIPRAPGPSKKVPVSERIANEEQGDSSFSFTDGPSDADGSPATSANSAAARRRDRAAQHQSSSPGGFSDVSPIPAQDEFGIDDVRMERVSDTGTAVEQSSFMKRLSACAAPLSRAFTQNTSGGALPSAHLEFMRTNPAGQGSSPNKGSGRFVPAGLCGRPDIITENEDSEDDASKRSLTDNDTSPPTSPGSQILKEVKGRASSRGRSRPSPTKNVGSDMRSSSSGTSDDFGARTSYLEAIAMRAAVSSKKKKSRRIQDKDRQSVVSDDASGSTFSHSERWQAFLERKASQTASPPGSHTVSSTDVSRAAEKYASEKVQEIMEVMASRSKSTPKSWRDEDHTLDTSYGDSSTASPLSPYRMAADGDRSISTSKKSKKKSESAKAAEELAAARVEAMMAAMTISNLDEGEI